MKKICILILLVAFGCRLNAQIVTLSTITQPCDSNGVIVAHFTGITLPFVVQWSTANGNQTDIVSSGSTDTLRGFVGGSVTISGTSGPDTVIYTSNAYLNVPFSTNTTVTNGVCPGIGSLSAAITGGTPPFSYQWINTATSAVVGTSNPISVPVGYYKLKITDATGCVSGTWQNGYSVNVGLDFGDSTTSTYAMCPALGTATVHVYGNPGPFTYSWTNAAGAIVGNTSIITQPGGNYQVTVSEGSGCTSTINARIVTIPDFTYSVSVTNAVCPSVGSANITTTGGTPPFSYLWESVFGIVLSTTNPAPLPGGQYIGTITDGDGCSAQQYMSISVLPDFTATLTTTPANCTNGTASAVVTGGTLPLSYLWSNGATTSSISGLVAGRYRVLISDAIGCSNAPSDSTTEGYVNQAITITVNTTATPATCIANNGTSTATSFGGTAPYTYLWGNGGTTPSISGLSDGFYNVVSTDANGCTGTSYSYVNTIVPLSIPPPATTPSICNGATGTATLSGITGGTAPYSIFWYSTPAQTGNTATGLAAGYYSIRVTDAAGCTKITSVIIPPVYAINIAYTTTPATCTLSNGNISVTPSGGVGPYTYVWSGSSITSSSRSGLAAGVYPVTITDANGCIINSAGTVPEHSSLSVGISTTQASCVFTADGTLTATAAAGTPPYNYSMGGSSSGAVTVNSLHTGDYVVYVTDASGCAANGHANVAYNISNNSCYCTIQGTVYKDHNQNCTQDADDTGLANAQIHCSNYQYAYTDANGHYSIMAPTGTYTVTQTVAYGYNLAACQSNNIPVTVTASPGCIIPVNFADTVNYYHDLSIRSWNYSKPILGFSYSQITVISNNGTYTEPSITASYWADGAIYAPTFVPSGYYSGAPYYYTATGIPALAPGTSTSFYMNYMVPASVPLGTILEFKDTVSYMSPLSTWVNDSTPWNNVDYFNPYTVGPYDPNFKEVKPQGYGPEGYIDYSDSVLEYMVHFQNTGTYAAQNVVVTDTLDPSLDWSTLSPTYMSAKGTAQMDESGHVTFTFNNIDLPPSSSEPFTSNGLFSYTVKTKPNLPAGTTIRNRASIYFDYNAPITTGYTLNTIVNHIPYSANNLNSSVRENTFTLYPNPANSTCILAINSISDGPIGLEVLDLSGRIILKRDITLQKGMQHISLDVSGFAPGAYFVTLYNNETHHTQKLIIMK